MRRLTIVACGSIALATTLISGVDHSSATGADDRRNALDRYPRGMLDALAKSDGVSLTEAAQRVVKLSDLIARID